MKALIQGGRVLQISEKPFPVADGFDWVTCPAEVRENWVYDGVVFAPPLTDAARAIARIDARLAEIDAASLRPLRAIQAETATEADRVRLAALEADAAKLRADRDALTE